MMSNTVPQDEVRVTYLAGYIVLSYLISAMGCATTLELLHRRTSKSGLYNWYALGSVHHVDITKTQKN